jgi:hypothetical protein
MSAMGRLPEYFSELSGRLFSTLVHPELLLAALTHNVSLALLNLGWFAIPLLILLLPRRQEVRQRMPLILAAVFVAFLFIFLFADDLLRMRIQMPVPGNVLAVQGIGPITLNQAYESEPAYLPSIGKPFWLSVTILGRIGGVLLLVTLLAGVGRSWRSYRALRLPKELAGGLFFLIAAAAYLVPVLAIGGFDRYFMPALPLLVVAAVVLAALQSFRPGTARWGESLARVAGVPHESHSVVEPAKANALAAIVLLAFMSVFSVAGTHDYFSWNRARWRGLHDLMVIGKATPEQIDGGFEFNGWHLYEPRYHPQKGQNFWWVRGNDYMVAFAPQAGYKVLAEYPYFNWLPPSRRKIVLLGKQGTPAENLKLSSEISRGSNS